MGLGFKLWGTSRAGCVQIPALPLNSNWNHPMENLLETLVPLPLAIRQLSPRNWNFPRNLHAGNRKRLVSARGGTEFYVVPTSCQTTLQEGLGSAQ